MAKSLCCIIFIMLCIPTNGTILEKKPSEIELAGKCERHKNRSLILPLEVYIDSNQVRVTFFESMENVTISIIGDEGVMETRTVSFADFQTEVFDVGPYTTGSYNLLITTPRGTNLSGSFRTDE